jgi:hypothetical protein
MIRDRLEIFVFTYNRAAHLASTLGEFAEGPLKECAITILDNASTDSTPAVVAEFAGRLPALSHVRHPKNIGGLANYLRAIELAAKEYCWVVCDDDSFNFDHFGDVAEMILAGGVDAVSVGVEGHGLTLGRRGTCAAFAREEPFFLAHSFVPSLIFKTSLFDSGIIRAGYDNIDTMFPHFPFLASLVRRDVSIAVSAKAVISKSANVGYSTYRFLTGWLKSCRKISERAVRSKALSEVFGGVRFWQNGIYCALTEKAYRPEAAVAEYLELLAQARLTSLRVTLGLLCLLPLVAAPRWVHRPLWEAYRKYRARKGLPLPCFDEGR